MPYFTIWCTTGVASGGNGAAARCTVWRAQAPARAARRRVPARARPGRPPAPGAPCSSRRGRRPRPRPAGPWVGPAATGQRCCGQYALMRKAPHHHRLNPTGWPPGCGLQPEAGRCHPHGLAHGAQHGARTCAPQFSHRAVRYARQTAPPRARRAHRRAAALAGGASVGLGDLGAAGVAVAAGARGGGGRP